MKDLISRNKIKEIAKNSIIDQSKAIKNLANFIDDSFLKSVEIIYDCKGRVVVTGVGKSAIIANKIVATMNSTGTPSIFMHAGDAIHGDLGLIKKGDIIICISKSGNTAEIKALIPILKQTKNPIVAITGNKSSILAKNADFVLNSYVEKEVCPNNLAPTTSTTAQIVIGDAIAICLLELRKFTKNDFAKFHPGGILGKKLFLKVKDLSKKNESPEVNPTSPVKDVILEISQKRLGVTAVTLDKKILGIITDGDLRRMLSKTDNINNISAMDIMSKKPKTINQNSLAVEAIELMKLNGISSLLVVDDDKYIGVVHIHDLINEGII
ncbi:MAG: D-arabinose 5-phosphate isomerase [Flavobacteriaceae bacterium]|nr:D-arabinose 5-phosphate isomerase [Flavobacteriaceae bacterium]|tara:strand:+ start:12433 stop:13407 length:975 start_codon:yes stop_codon:yes gene_type:complete